MGNFYGYESYELKGSGTYTFGQKEVSGKRLIRCRGIDAVPLAGKLWWSTVGSGSSAVLWLPPSHPRVPFIYVNEITVRPLTDSDQITVGPDGMILNAWCVLEVTYKSLNFEPQSSQFQTIYTEHKEYGGEIMTIPKGVMTWDDDNTVKADETYIWVGHMIVKIGFPMIPEGMQINDAFLFGQSGSINNAAWRNAPAQCVLFTGASTDYAMQQTQPPAGVTQATLTMKQAKTLELSFDVRSQPWNKAFKPTGKNAGTWQQVNPPVYTQNDFTQFSTQTFMASVPGQS